EKGADLDLVRRAFIGAALIGAHRERASRQIDHLDPGLGDDCHGAVVISCGTGGSTLELGSTPGIRLGPPARSQEHRRSKRSTIKNFTDHCLLPPRRLGQSHADSLLLQPFVVSIKKSASGALLRSTTPSRS